MTPDFHAMCAELVDALDSGIPAARLRMSPLADRARALLAEPEAEGLTDEELSPQAQAVLDACDQAFDQCGTTAQGLAAALRAAALYCKRDSGILLSLADELQQRANA